jgi:thioredoxin reductase (NADPH)
MSEMPKPLPVDLIVVGGGPAGLSCAIEARKAGLSVLLLEKGSLVDAIRRFPRNLIWFSTPELLEIGGIPFVTPNVRPTRVETIAYYQRVAGHFKIECRYFDAVERITREGDLLIAETSSAKQFVARNIVLATGYFDTPNELGVPGETHSGVRHYYDEPFEFYGSRVAVVGGRNSAVEASLDLFRHGVHVTLIHRGDKLSQGVKYWILPDIENRMKAGEVSASFNSVVREIRPGVVHLATPEGAKEVHADFVFVLIGYRPDTDLIKRFGIEVDPESLAPVFEPSTFETNIRGLYVAGSLVAGRNNNKVFVENGRLHGSVIVSAILARR